MCFSFRETYTLQIWCCKAAKYFSARFQAMAAKSNKSALFGHITQHIAVVPYRRFGQPIGPVFKGQEILPLYAVHAPEERTSQIFSLRFLKYTTA